MKKSKKETFNHLYRLLGYTFNNPQLLKQALTHRSLRKNHNERLEFLGDAVLGAIISDALYQKRPHASEGELSHMRSALVCESQLVALATELQLSSYISIGRSERGQPASKKRPALLADALEAIIGAIYLDSDWQRCQERVLAWYTHTLDRVQYIQPVKDAKTILQEYVQAKRYALPRYRVASQSGDAHHPIFTITCELESIQGQHIACTGLGNNRRQAEQHAAEKLLSLLHQHHDRDLLSHPLDQSLDNTE